MLWIPVSFQVAWGRRRSRLHSNESDIDPEKKGSGNCRIWPDCQRWLESLFPVKTALKFSYLEYLDRCTFFLSYPCSFVFLNLRFDVTTSLSSSTPRSSASQETGLSLRAAPAAAVEGAEWASWLKDGD